eukprot:TRINITY_DN2626_c0_g1_i2.p1 TRINITY_DN2626_c0_g1~~TRINITY_DN2626_c0_g1_i2.p1  ORF type:complete len:281 (-),score=53.45 TRINITY_DN2626_c0_g1_i2:347-1189(-)
MEPRATASGSPCSSARMKLRQALKNWDELSLPPVPSTPREIGLQSRVTQLERELREATSRHATQLEQASVLTEQAEMRATRLQAENQALEESVDAMRRETVEAERMTAATRDQMSGLRRESEEIVAGNVSQQALKARVAELERDAEEATTRHIEAAALITAGRAEAVRVSTALAEQVRVLETQAVARVRGADTVEALRLLQDKCVAGAEWLHMCGELRSTVKRAYRFHSRAIISLFYARRTQGLLRCVLRWALQAQPQLKPPALADSLKTARLVPAVRVL